MSRALTLLKTFSKKEINQFEKFLKSPYHNKSESVLNYFYKAKKKKFDANKIKVSYYTLLRINLAELEKFRGKGFNFLSMNRINSSKV